MVQINLGIGMQQRDFKSFISEKLKNKIFLSSVAITK